MCWHRDAARGGLSPFCIKPIATSEGRRCVEVQSGKSLREGKEDERTEAGLCASCSAEEENWEG